MNDSAPSPAQTTKRLLILSIPHTGTHLLRDHIFKYNKINVTHIWPAGVDHSAIKAADNIVIPLRHPLDIALSWKQRDKPLRDLNSCFILLDAMLGSLPDALLMPIDIPDRDKYLSRIQNKLNMSLLGGWPMVREKRGPSYKIDRTTHLTHEEKRSGITPMNPFKKFYV